MTARELEKLITKAGWIHKNTKGSHKQFVHPNKPGKITIPQHRGDISIDTAKRIMLAAGIEEGCEQCKS